MNGYITLDKKILEWEWYKSHNELIVFIHLLLTCNYEPKTWRGIKINRGQIITSYESLSNQTGLSIRSVRTAISNLKLTGELTSQATNKFSLLTICKYDDYQSKNKKTDKQTAKPTGKPKAKPTDKRTDRLTDKPTDNNISNTININKDKPQQNSAFEVAEFVAPTFNQVREFFHEAKLYNSNPWNFYQDVKLTPNWKQDAINYANGKR